MFNASIGVEGNVDCSTLAVNASVADITSVHNLDSYLQYYHKKQDLLHIVTF